jgi:lactate dehydrogenase-like 2-hydroxyacid dehydrogenase
MKQTPSFLFHEAKPQKKSFSRIVSHGKHSHNEKDRLLILGFGRVGQKVAQLVLADQDNAMEVMATTRKQATTDCTSQDEQADATTFKNQVQLVPYDQAIDCLNSCSHILISMPLDLFVDQSAASADLLQASMAIMMEIG